MTTATAPRIDIGPQAGPQTIFAETPADIAIFGGSAFSGKTYSLLFQPIIHLDDPNFGALIFRRTYGEIKDEGGMWDESTELYSALGGVPKETRYEWIFPSGARVRFQHMEYEKDRLRWKGAQIPLIGFDQLETFTQKQFFYLTSRNRSAKSGAWPYVRATCNPVNREDPIGGWLREFIAWWINDTTGLPIPERRGVIRWYVMDGDTVTWGASSAEMLIRYGADCDPISVTFINALPTDNPIGMRQDPTYMAKLKNLPRVDRERLLVGNWNARETAGMFFKREDFEIVPHAPQFIDAVRCWDRAATDESEHNSGSASSTAGALLGKDANGVYYLADMRCFKKSAYRVSREVIDTAERDTVNVSVAIFQDPGAAGKAEAQDMLRQLAGYDIHTLSTAPPAPSNMVMLRSSAKAIYARPWSRQAEGGNFKLVAGPWVESFLQEAENFDGSHACRSDRIDAVSGGFHVLANAKYARAW